MGEILGENTRSGGNTGKTQDMGGNIGGKYKIWEDIGGKYKIWGKYRKTHDMGGIFLGKYNIWGKYSIYWGEIQGIEGKTFCKIPVVKDQLFAKILQLLEKF